MLIKVENIEYEKAGKLYQRKPQDLEWMCKIKRITWVSMDLEGMRLVD